MTSTGSQHAYDAWTIAELERFGCDDPYDPRFIYRAVFGTGMRGRPRHYREGGGAMIDDRLDAALR